MPVAAIAPIIGGALGLGGSLLGAGISSNAAHNASQLQYQSSQNALDFQKTQWNQQQQNLAPWLSAGGTALSTLMSEMPELTKGFDPTAAGLPSQFGAFQAPAPFKFTSSDFQQDPGYQFALQQAQQAIQRSAASRGTALGGGTLKALTDYTTGSASQEFNNAYNRAQGTYQTNFNDSLNSYGTNLNTYLKNYSDAFNTYETNQGNRYNRLAGVAGAGQSAANTLGSEGTAFANAAGNDVMQGGNALASGAVGSANAWNSGIGSGLGALNSGIAGYAAANSPQQQYYQQLLQQFQQAQSASGYGGSSKAPSVDANDLSAYGMMQPIIH